MLPVIDRYILLEMLKAFAAILIVLLVIVIGNSYVAVLKDAAAGAISNQALLQLVSLEGLQILGFVIPPAFFFSILYTLGRLYRDSEMTALNAGGVSVLRIYRSVFLVAVPLSLLVAWLTFDLLPWVNHSKVVIEHEQEQEVNEISGAVAGRFNEFSRGDLVFYAEDISDDKTRLRNVFVQSRQHGGLALITAAEGYRYIDQNGGDEYMVLTNGYRYKGEPGQGDYAVGDFEKYAVRLSEERNQGLYVPVKAIGSAELYASDDIRKRSEFQFRLMFPLAVLVFTLVSFPLSRSLPREGIYGRLVLALLFYFVFLNMQAISASWMVEGVTPAWMGRWWVHPFMLVLALLVWAYKTPAANLRRLTRRRGVVA
ncbi:MAG: LPS export ABC transporter permease LptF [Candidatus Sedimenticola endophacoides]|uniref:Lipopolysaccharide export system permease protein LptF n=1 Tax=Candidatus Sedimenticola endophacoides TaxID=2548426 RepID=A0A657PUC1_9GAMM|nr:MAG: LPS export ABC transporter permease LptF [Candidatus Sedimenticola endophacoides]OQX36491.1 MAG: LPS export ABC transporter permease LptF [Candidatus Sedimenticola endophacoides]OQX36873.1 MAG: LPS export ABC transporter permease LptF [Candidatus Sedimenticola endophacoides]OQX41264.1 MAG: LPS export ABC transporter permease LptF [Candidatus Sedimenticola endophacoides]OQX44445.1 MAG: LPS export ABC transporter permease LptF [Candidatus Sedimenticola endophacoides]